MGHWIPASAGMTRQARQLRMLMMVWVSLSSVEITCAFAW
jgi:hypothetical protein